MTVIEFEGKDRNKDRESKVPPPIPVPDYIHRKWIQQDEHTREWIGSDIWRCDYCPNYGDVWFMAQHTCKASRISIQDVKSENSAPISLWKICPDCNKSIHIYDRTHYLICKEEDRIAIQESKKRLLKNHAPRSPEQDYYDSNVFASSKANSRSKVGLRASYIANLRRKARNLNKEPDFQSRKAVLEKLDDGQYYWVHYDTRTKVRIGQVEKAKKEELSCWDPTQPDGIDHSREVKG